MNDNPNAITFTILGKAATQGSKVSHALYNRATGAPLMKNGRVITITREDNVDLKNWRNMVASAAREAYDGPLLLCAIRLTVRFERPRASSHFGSGKNAAVLKGSAPRHPVTRPDTIKLTRAVEDALTGVVWKDDSQVCEHFLFKTWGPISRTVVTIETLL
jgi:Holliday junction resolvase RusA-like endonuclease